MDLERNSALTPDFELPSGQSLNNTAIIWTSVCDAACLPELLAYSRVLICETFQVQCVTFTASFPFQEVLSDSTVDEETEVLCPWYEITGLARHCQGCL